MPVLSLPTIRRITVQDDIQVACLIRQVMKEYGANREGFAFVDVELDAMSFHYPSTKAQYFVLARNERIVGGGGFAPLQGESSEHTAELRKMYFLPEARGHGWGRALLDLLIAEAAKAGYQSLYLETFSTMKEAAHLYLHSGFSKLAAPLGNTGHFACDCWMLRPLP